MNIYKKLVTALWAAVVAASFTGCGGASNPSVPVSLVVSPTSATLMHGTSQKFTATVTGLSNVGVTWSANGGTIDGAGETVTYTAPNTSGVYTITATSIADPSKSQSATITSIPPQSPPVSVSIDPRSPVLRTGESMQFTATLGGTTNASVTWSASAGAITASGNYIAPNVAGVYSVTATSVADPTKFQTVQVVVNPPETTPPANPNPSVVSISGMTPASASLQIGASTAFTATVTGSSNIGITWKATGGVISSNGYYTAPSDPGTYAVIAISDADPSKYIVAPVLVTAKPQIDILVSPAAANLQLGGTQQFSAAINGNPSSEVVWTASGGTVTAAGLYTAPSKAGLYSVTATSVADATRSQTVNVQVSSPPVSISVSPTYASIPVSGTQQFTAAISGSANTAVNWTSSSGTINASGLFTASNQAGNVTITGTSSADPSVSQSVTVAVLASSGFTTHGLNIPAGHPRLWWTPSRIQAAKDWLAAGNTVSLGSTAFANYDINRAWRHVVQGQDCSAAVTSALQNIPSYAQTLPTSIGSDNVRAGAEPALVVFDWCYDQFGTTSNVNTTTSGALSVGQAITFAVANPSGIFVGQSLVVDSGANQESIIVSGISGSNVKAYNVKLPHASGVTVVGQSQKDSFISNWNYWLGNVEKQTWGGLGMPQNNYFTGNLRNDVEWGIVSYGDNGSGPGSIADNFIHAGLGQVGETGSNTRWTAFKTSAASPGSTGFGGGVPVEGTEYGTAFASLMIPFQSTQLMGRDVFNETGFFKEMMFWLLYATTPAPTFNIASGTTAYGMFAWADDEIVENGGIISGRNYWQNLANLASNYFASTNVGKIARYWYNTVTSDAKTLPADTFVRSQDANPPALDPSGNLPLDYYATGIQYAWLRTAWDTSSTALMLQMGDSTLGGGAHPHSDFGSFSIWRGGRWLMRETTGYSNNIAGTPGINGNSNQQSDSALAHNVPVFTNVALGIDSGPFRVMPTLNLSGPVVKRLETQPGYFYADVDLSGVYHWDAGHAHLETGAAKSVEREFLYVRGLETLVVFDRILTGNQTRPTAMSAAQVVTSSVTHFETQPVQSANVFQSTNGSQVVRQTVLLPTNVAAPRIVNEASCAGCDAVGQWRLEIDASGAAQRYLLNVIQSRSATQGNVLASVVDSAPADPNSGTFTVTLHPSAGADTTIVFKKGQSSVGGTISVAGTTAMPLRATVQSISYPDSGPVWTP